MTTMHTAAVAGIALPLGMPNAVVTVLVVLAVLYGFLFWATLRAAHERERS